MDGYGAPHGNSGNGINAGQPFYRGTHQTQMARKHDGDESTADGGPRYVPPHMREEVDIIRPESSMSNASNQTFATQAPMGNYSYGPSQLTNNMAAFNPFNNARGAQQQAYMPSQVVYQGRGPNRAGFQGVNGANGANGANRTNTTSTTTPANSNTAIAAPTPVRRDSAAPESRAEYLANRIKQGHADNPFDPDYGNPGPSRRPAPLPTPHPFPSQKSPGSGNRNVLGPKMNGKKVAENTDGNPKAFLGSGKVKVPAWFAAALGGTLPTMEQAFPNMPFIEACRYAIPSTAGVVKVKNIPYATSRSEVNAFLGKNTQICFQPSGSPFHAVHIIMDRHSGKTMDAFIEVSNAPEAVWVVNQFQKRIVQGRQGKIGDRAVEVELSSQDELMATMFPRAKNVSWDGGVPKVDPKIDTYYAGIHSTGFKGFLQDEEIVHMQKHAETPQRSPFAQRCMIRTYESLISTLYKFPWFAHEHVLLAERDALYECTHASVRALIGLLRRLHHEKADATKPTLTTLTELATAIFVCPGFTDAQKNSIATTMQQSGFGKNTDDRALNLRFGGVDEFAPQMPFVALVKQPGVEAKVVEYFATLFTDATTGMKQLSLADIHAMNASSGKDIPKFGDLSIDYKNAIFLADAGRAELRYIEHILGRILERAGGRRTGSGSASRASSLQLQ